MKETKIRAWNKKEKKFVSQDIVDLWAIFTLESHEGSSYVMMQSVGLKDKNGREIYEGDILKHSFQTKIKIMFPYTESNNLGWEIWEIKYIAPSFMYIIHSQDNSYYGELPSKPREISCHYLPSVEVIGNIFENPELLK